MINNISLPRLINIRFFYFIISFNILLISNGGAQPSASDKIVDMPYSEKLDSLIKAFNIPDARVDQNSEIKNNQNIQIDYGEKFFQRAQEIISKQVVPNNIEFKVYLYSRLGVCYIEKKSNKQASEELYKARDYANLLEQPKRSKYLANIESNLLPVLNEERKYEEAISLAQKIIKEYQGVGTGLLKNIVASSALDEFVYAAKSHKWSNDKIKLHLQKITDTYTNEVACKADLHLLRIAEEQKDEKTIKMLKNKILTRYPKTWEYTNIYQSYFDAEIK